MSDTTVSVPKRSAPLVSEHQEEVMAALGYTSVQVEAMVEKGVLLPPVPLQPEAKL